MYSYSNYVSFIDWFFENNLEGINKRLEVKRRELLSLIKVKGNEYPASTTRAIEHDGRKVTVYYRLTEKGSNYLKTYGFERFKS